MINLEVTLPEAVTNTGILTLDSGASGPRAAFWRTSLIMAMLCLWESFPLGILGINPLIGYQIYGLACLLGLPIYLITRVVRNLSIDLWSILAIVLFAWCCVVSVNYSVFTVPQPLMQWLPAIYTVAPVLITLLLVGLGANLADAQWAILLTGLFASTLIVAESLLHTGLLDYYARGSAFGAGKIVFFKLISAFALMIALVQAAQARTLRAAVLNLVMAALTGYNSIFLSESRILSAAAVLAVALTWLFVLRGTRKIIAGAIAPLVIIPTLWLVVSRYFSGFVSINEYLANDVSANWRKTTAQHFATYFADTRGMGFGFMSGNPDYNNVIAFSAHQASELYGVKNYVVALDDIGLSSALYQYGYFGLAFILLMSIMCIFGLTRAHRIDARYAPVSAMGILMGTLMINPVAMNYFTLFYTAHIGGLLWFMVGEVGRLKRTVSA